MHVDDRVCFVHGRSMKEGPNISIIGALIGDPARANMLTALMSGKALTATELSTEAGITNQTASAHLKKLEAAGLLVQRKQGRHRYFSIADDDVGSVLEGIMGLAAKRGHTRTRTGPKDPALRKARICYDHLAGDFGVRMFDSLIAHNLLVENRESLDLTNDGHSFAVEFGIDVDALGKQRRPMCRSCLDWSSRRTHLAGGLGTALLNRFYELKWAKREEGSRIIAFSPSGEKKFKALFPG